MGLFDIIHFTEASLEHRNDEPSVWACFGFYPKEITWTHLVYDAVMYGEHLDEPIKAIVKLRRLRPGNEEFWQPRLDANIHASGVALAFREKTGAGKIFFVEQYLAPLKGYTRWDKFCRGMKHYDFRDFRKDELVLIESLIASHLETFLDDVILDAFSHFSYIEGNGQSVIAAFKGRKSGNEYHLITPKIYTSHKEISKFFSEHICNDLCSGWNKPNVIVNSNVPLFDLASDSLKLQRQTSMRVQDPGEHTLQMQMSTNNSDFSRNPSVLDRQSTVSSPNKKKVTTIMHAVYVHEDSKLENSEKRAPMQKMISAPYIDNAIRKEKSDVNTRVLKTHTDQNSPRTKNKPVHTIDSHNVGIPKQLNVPKSGKPEIKPKPVIKQKPEVKQKPNIKPKPEIKPKPKLKRQDRTENDDSEINEKIGAQKMAVQDELKAKLSKINNKEKKVAQTNLSENVDKVNSGESSEKVNEKEANVMVLVPGDIKTNTDLQLPEIPTAPELSDITSSQSATESPKLGSSITEKKVKSKKSLRKQATLAT